jgi:hypothetical protein
MKRMPLLAFAAAMVGSIAAAESIILCVDTAGGSYNGLLQANLMSSQMHLRLLGPPQLRLRGGQDEDLDAVVADTLRTAGLWQHRASFEREGIRARNLPDLTSEDLDELGLSGPEAAAFLAQVAQMQAHTLHRVPDKAQTQRPTQTQTERQDRKMPASERMPAAERISGEQRNRGKRAKAELKTGENERALTALNYATNFGGKTGGHAEKEETAKGTQIDRYMCMCV